MSGNMVYKCSVDRCRSNYASEKQQGSISVYKLPKNREEREKWIEAIPFFRESGCSVENYRICKKHWPSSTPMVKMPGGCSRPVLPPSVFTCIPLSENTPKPEQRVSKKEFKLQSYFDKKDVFTSFESFSPEKELLSKYTNVVVDKHQSEIDFIFMNQKRKEMLMIATVANKPSLCSPVTFCAHKRGIKVPIPRGILNPNSGLNRYSQFLEAINFAIQYELPANSYFPKVAEDLGHVTIAENDKEKLQFICRQLQLLCTTKKAYSTSDYCFAMEHFPTCRYTQLRRVLVLPSESNMRSVVSSADTKKILQNTFTRTTAQQKNSFLIIDEVKVRPTVTYSGGFLSGYSTNDPAEKASSILAVMLKCMHGGPSTMVSVIPVHKMTASFQYTVVIKIAKMVEECGGVVLGSITDNHKVNQKYCTLFDRKSVSHAVHPLDDKRTWFLLFDTVHLLKCIRNNWIKEKTKQLTFDKQTVGKFEDVQDLYKKEMEGILKITTLTSSSVYTSHLQLQNVKYVLQVFNEKVVAALQIEGKSDTAAFIEQVLKWWKMVNVKCNGEGARFSDDSRLVQTCNSTNLRAFMDLFTNADSGFGINRVKSVTHDTKKALVQTMEGLLGVCKHLLNNGFNYVALGEIQSDRIEGEFSIYRQSTGANSFMSVGDVMSCFKKRLAKFSAKFCQEVLVVPSVKSHACRSIDITDASVVERIHEVALTSSEEYAAAYVAGWIERKCAGMEFCEEDLILESSKACFIEEVSRGSLVIPHTSTFEIVRAGLRFSKGSRQKMCCQKQLVSILCTINNFYDFGSFGTAVLRRIANVLLNGLHKLEKDNEKNTVLYQTSLKKARLS